MTIHETTSEERARVLAHFDSVQRRTRKGRSTFEVTGRRERRMSGAHPLLPDSVPDWESGTIYDPTTGLTHRADLSAFADAWMRAEHPEAVSVVHGGTQACVCDDLTQPAIVIDRGTGRPIWVGAKKDGTPGHYVIREMVVRHCHCGWARLLGTDMGLSWAEMTPNPYRAAYRSARKGQGNGARTAKRQARRHAVTAPWADEAAIITAALAETDAPVVEVTSFPDVVVAIRRQPNGRMAVTLTRGAEVVRFRARTAGAVARRVIA